MEYRILGPLEVRSDSGEIALGGAKPRVVLAVLLLNAREAVSAEQLAIALWGAEAPNDGPRTVQVHVSRLRKALGDPGRIETTPAGYRLYVEPGELDAAVFDELVADGRSLLAEGKPEEAAAVLREALELWRGRPLSDLADEPFAAIAIMRLTEQRLAALELRVDADLAAGWHAPLVGELRQLVATHPTRERLAEQLMLALYRVGRQADALDVFRDTREQMVAELGIEPGSGLRDLHGAILRQDPALESPHGETRPRSPGTEPPPSHAAAPRASRRWRRRLATGLAALALLGAIGVVLTRGDALRSGSSVASESSYRADVQRVCASINAATRDGVREQKVLQRSLERARGTAAVRDAVLIATRRAVARGGQNLASLRALAPVVSEARLHAEAARAWGRSLDRLREYASRLDAASSRADLSRAVTYLHTSRSAIDRDGVTVAAALERLGRPRCRLQRVALAPVRLPPAPQRPARGGSPEFEPGDPFIPVLPDRTAEPTAAPPEEPEQIPPVAPEGPDVQPPTLPSTPPTGPQREDGRLGTDAGTRRPGTDRGTSRPGAGG